MWDLLSDLPAFERFDARVGDLSYYVRAQPDAHFDALVSDDNPGNMAQIGEEEFQRLHRVLQRFYRMIVVDTGNNVRSANWQAAVNAADLVVVVSTYQRDVGYSASWVLDHLAQTGREDLARNAVSILTAAEPTSDKEVRDQLLSATSPPAPAPSSRSRTTRNSPTAARSAGRPWRRRPGPPGCRRAPPSPTPWPNRTSAPWPPGVADQPGSVVWSHALPARTPSRPAARTRPDHRTDRGRARGPGRQAAQPAPAAARRRCCARCTRRGRTPPCAA